MEAIDLARQVFGDQGYIFCDGTDTTDPMNVTAQFRNCWLKLKAEAEATGTTPLVQKAATAHSFRRAAGARWLAQGIGIYTVATVLGHSVAVCERHYAGITRRDLHRWFKGIDDVDAASALVLLPVAADKA